ncbi:ABC transporter substrate-binding protein [Nonomuraea gerenzanensis]|uniref:Oligopeptide ABC transporter, periplasmic oligopeptide-binding protein OppA (TC 3.A.1.5.1) n=1 Tax=Nonomuraea gerenzanensis TaxID=93944 RepID=A0A1M4EDG0_9ACTN|nr:ABC transporter substrate-binding protein [Nonomuraea gerenzanensis]UBU08413.1 ABC transporter substrate-binding protein [Nonomuraea gerenzanensis]SBO96756.1 Oligopeptide ABC transporter, periplasmic oligopeptide-binding protein OppA (TC 3.A.1.5.1) [Nonomuraea gerenzanensis]
MTPTRTRALAALALTLTASAALAACGSDAPGTAAPGSSAAYASGKTFTLNLASDPGALDPQGSATSALFGLTQYAYDNLVAVAADGSIQPQLAASWKVAGTTVTLQLKDGVTCADGTAFTAQTVVDNITYVVDPDNKSPFLGVFIPAGTTASASGSTVTLKLAAPAPFVLTALANLPMVCDAGMKDRATLKAATNGTGPYVLTEAVPSTRYTYELRKGYTWGPGGATTAEAGMPAKVVVKIVANETTSANELLAGTINAVQITGPDADRLSKAGLERVNMQALVGEQWYNQGDGHATDDPAVRMALTQALDLKQLQVALTSGKGVPPTQLAALEPLGCVGDAVTGHVPSFDVAAAGAALDAAGWTKGPDGVRAKDGKKLSLTLIYPNSLGTGGGAAAELAVAAWKAAGIEVTAKQQTQTEASGAVFGTGAWDIVWMPLNVSTPDQVMPFVSGPTAPKGTNFAAIDNAGYQAAAAKAMKANGVDGCKDWFAAEQALYKAADVVPFANNLVPTFVKGAKLSIIGSIVPTSIRMLG